MRFVSRLLGVWAALTLVFILMRLLPGDAISSQLTEIGASAALIEERRQALGLDKAPIIQYIEYLGEIIRGDWGESLTRGISVSSLIAAALPHTLLLTLAAISFATATGMLLGILSAFRIGYGVSLSARLLTSLSISTPIYWSATLGILLFSVKLDWLPSSGADRIEHLILPTLILGFHGAGAIASVTYSNITETLQGDYIRTAQAKGLLPRQILLHHTLRSSLPSVITVVALQAGFLLAGTIIIEQIFVRPGIGRLLLNAVLSRDYPLVQAVVSLSAIVFILLNFLSDTLHILIDPRLRFKS